MYVSMYESSGGMWSLMVNAWCLCMSYKNFHFSQRTSNLLIFFLSSISFFISFLLFLISFFSISKNSERSSDLAKFFNMLITHHFHLYDINRPRQIPNYKFKHWHVVTIISAIIYKFICLKKRQRFACWINLIKKNNVIKYILGIITIIDIMFCLLLLSWIQLSLYFCNFTFNSHIKSFNKRHHSLLKPLKSIHNSELDKRLSLSHCFLFFSFSLWQHLLPLGKIKLLSQKKKKKTTTKNKKKRQKTIHLANGRNGKNFFVCL